MKQLLFIFLISGLTGCEEQLEIPLKVSKNFWYKYENAVETEWTLANDTYTVKFNLNQFPKTATYKVNGEWIKTISPLPPRRSMVCVRDFVDENYYGATILEAIFIETPSSEKYFIKIEKSSLEEEVDSVEVQDEFENPNSEEIEPVESIVLEFNSDCDFVGEKP